MVEVMEVGRLVEARTTHKLLRIFKKFKKDISEFCT